MTPIGIDQDEADARIAAIGVLESTRNAANGFAGLDADGDIVATPIHRYESISDLRDIVLADGELAYASDVKDTFVGDGSTTGGIFLSGGYQKFVGGPTELTSSLALAYALTSRVASNSLYRVQGYIGFSGDTDSLSNWKIRLTSGGILPLEENLATQDTSKANSLRTTHGTADWVYATGTTTSTARQHIVTTSSSGAVTLNATDLTKQFAYCYLDLWVPFADYTSLGETYDGQWQIQVNLRTAKVGNPTIVSAYRLAVQRVA